MSMSMMTLLSQAINKHIKIYRTTDPHIDTTGAVIEILKLYEGERYEDVMRGGVSVAKGLPPQEWVLPPQD